MALDKETFLENLYQQAVNKIQYDLLAQQRAAEEAQLVIDFKVNECNAARAALQQKYAELYKPLVDSNNAIVVANMDAVKNG